MQRAGTPSPSRTENEQAGDTETIQAGKDAKKPDATIHYAHLRDKDAKLDAGRRVMTGSDGELEAGAVEDPSGERNLKLMRRELNATALASGARLGPRFAASTAVVARAAHGHLERHHGAVSRLAMRQSDRRTQRGRPLVREKRVPHPIDGGCHRWKIDDDLVREATLLCTTIGPGDDRHWSGAEPTKSVAAHTQWLP